MWPFSAPVIKLHTQNLVSCSVDYTISSWPPICLKILSNLIYSAAVTPLLSQNSLQIPLHKGHISLPGVQALPLTWGLPSSPFLLYLPLSLHRPRPFKSPLSHLFPSPNSFPGHLYSVPSARTTSWLGSAIFTNKKWLQSSATFGETNQFQLNGIEKWVSNSFSYSPFVREISPRIQPLRARPRGEGWMSGAAK